MHKQERRWLAREIEDYMARPDANTYGLIGWLVASSALSDERQHQIVSGLIADDYAQRMRDRAGIGSSENAVAVTGAEPKEDRPEHAVEESAERVETV